MIDTHVHLHDAAYNGDRENVLVRMRETGVSRAITIGTSVQESKDAVVLSKKHKNIFATVGLHPHVFNGGVKQIEEWEEKLGADQSEAVRLAALDAACAELTMIVEDCKKVVAIGEIGLDYFTYKGNISDTQKEWQKVGFIAQVLIARTVKLPVVIHGRGSTRESMDAYEDIIDVIMTHKDVQFIMHCYMGDANITKQLLVMKNVIFSFAGNVTFSKDNDDVMSKVLRMIPLERMMTETDGPYLTPAPHRGKRNESAYVQFVVEHIAKIKKLSKESVVKQTVKNAERFFNLS